MKIRLGPGQEETFSTEWNLTYQSGDPVPPGIYQVQAMLDCDKPVVSDILTVEVQGYEQDIMLYEGWNFISLPCYLETTNLFTVLQPVWQHCISIWTYDSEKQKWLEYVFSGTPLTDVLTVIEPGKGYLINMSGGATLTIVGRPINHSIISLSSGWNLVGCNSTIELPLDSALEFINCKSVYTYDSLEEKWIRYIPGFPELINTLTHLKPGKAYWIYVTEDDLWYID